MVIPLLLSLASGVIGVVVVVIRPGWPSVRAALLVVPLGGLVEGWRRGSVEGAAVGVAVGAAVAACACLGALAVRSVRARRSYLERGWLVARSQAREQDVLLREAVLREHQRMAGEIHDVLGHRLTLLAVQAGRLSLDEALTGEVRGQLSMMRELAADATQELGQTVQLLHGQDDVVHGGPVEDVVTRARESGLRIEMWIENGIESRLGDFTRAAVVRTVQEGLTNAARHAPEEVVRLRLAGADGARVELSMTNRRSGESQRRAGFGLTGLRHRAALLGGQLTTETGDEFTLLLRLPLDALPRESIREATTETANLYHVTRQQRSISAAMMLLVPLALAGLAVLVAGGWFVYATTASVMPAEDFARVQVGASRASTEKLLPRTQMLEAPRSRTDAQYGECHYYEASLSFFDRDDVYRVCFAQGEVAAATTIAALP